MWCSPTGTNGWYTSIPALRIESEDAESVVQSIWYKVGEGAWTAYSGPLALTEGDHEIKAYGVDNHGLPGELAYLRVRIEKYPRRALLDVQLATLSPDRKHEAAWIFSLTGPADML